MDPVCRDYGLEMCRKLALWSKRSGLELVWLLFNDAKDVEHDQFLQVMKKDGTNTSFTILYDFNSGKKTLKNRINNSVSSGEELDWIVAYGNSLQNKVEYKGKRWRYSNNAGTSSKWGGSSSYRFSNDDGIWGAANVTWTEITPGLI